MWQATLFFVCLCNCGIVPRVVLYFRFIFSNNEWPLTYLQQQYIIHSDRYDPRITQGTYE